MLKLDTSHTVVNAYTAPLSPSFKVNLPKGALVLDVQMQRGNTKMVVAVNSHPDAEREDREFGWVGSGHELGTPEGKRLVYVGTVQEQGGIYIWHLFEVVAAE